MPESTASTARPNGAAPWVVAGVLALVVAALALLLVRTYSVRDDDKRSAGSPFAPTADQMAAVQAGATEAANITTYSRKNFDKDFQRALDGATGKLQKDLASKKSLTLSQMTKGKFDLKSTVQAKAFVAADGDDVQILVTLNGQRLYDSAQNGASVTAPQRLQLTMVKKDGKWLANDLTSVIVS